MGKKGLWDQINLNDTSGVAGMDDFLVAGDAELFEPQGLSDHYHRSVQHITEHGRKKTKTTYSSGSRVTYRGNAGDLVPYVSDLRMGQTGTVVTVLSKEGNHITERDGRVFVKWDTGSFIPVNAHHLKRSRNRIASTFQIRSASIDAFLGDFMRVANRENELVHKATHDLWALSDSGDGQFVVSRLFTEDGEPVKV
jgi:hypothetical protein